uniref:Choline transporter-like protein n=1 Tax=Aceria tosichella TaxID=561515 RepID=A0A6G1S432_9ACAR
MFIFLLIFLAFYGAYFYLSYQVILLNDLQEIFSQTAIKAQEDFRGIGERALEDLAKSYWNISIIILFATVLCFTWILLLKYNAEIIIWLSIFSLPILLSLGLYFSATTYWSLRDEAEASSRIELPYMSNEQLGIQPRFRDENDRPNPPYSQPTNSTTRSQPNSRLSPNKSTRLRNGSKPRPDEGDQNLEYDKALQNVLFAELMSYVRNETLWLIISIILFLVLFASVIILHALKERVTLSIALIKQASKAINGVKSTLLFPIIPRLIGIAALVYGVFISLLIVAASHPQSVAEHHAPLERKHVWKYHAVNVFATLWLIHFISGISQTTLAGAFASYYWAYSKPRDVPFFAVTASFWRCIRYHLGDIAFGSFLIATIRYIRIVIEFIDNRIRKKKANNGEAITSVARSATCFFRVFFWLLDRFLKYIDRNAYIMMSMYGEGYLASAKRAVELLYKNSTRALVLDYVTFFVLFISRLLITGIAGYITAQEVFIANLHYKWLPVVLVVIGTYFISKGLFSVYSMAVDTLFICFLIDSTNNDGSAERPYFMSKELRRIVKRNTVMA